MTNRSFQRKGLISEHAISFRIFYRPHTEYDGKVMFSVCLFTGGAPGYQPPPTGGRPRGYPPPPNWGTPPINLDKNVGQNMGQKIGQTFWKLLEVGGRGRYASCGHAGGLSCPLIFFTYFLFINAIFLCTEIGLRKPQ